MTEAAEATRLGSEPPPAKIKQALDEARTLVLGVQVLSPARRCGSSIRCWRALGVRTEAGRNIPFRVYVLADGRS